jgi:hypothetical protein
LQFSVDRPSPNVATVVGWIARQPADREWKLQRKVTKAALEDQRIATAKIRRIMGWLAVYRPGASEL